MALKTPKPPADLNEVPFDVKPKNAPRSLFEAAIVKRAAGDSFRKLDPRLVAKNPVMFVVEVGSVVTSFFFLRGLFTGVGFEENLFVGQVSFWLWFTVIFANFAEAMAEGRGKAQADALRKAKTDTIARQLVNGKEQQVPATALRRGDTFVCEAGDMVPADGEIVEGVASVDESAITGESAPVIRESGGDRSAVTGGTRVLSDRIVVVVSANPGESFLDRMIALVEGAERQKTPNEIALSISACRPHDHLSVRHDHASSVRKLQRCSGKARGCAQHHGAGSLARLPYSDHHRRFAQRNRNCGHGPSDAAQRACHVWPRGRGGRRR